jgi:enoyl-CoA hydratase/carnithine racemase
MLRTSPMGLRLTKEAVNTSVDAGSLDAALAMEDRHQALLMMTDDSVEAVMSFLEKREPNYKDA